MNDTESNIYASRAGIKLKYAIDHWHIDIKDKVAVDFGSSTGGFVDVLLQEKARKVYSVDTAYGQLEWKLRQDKRVILMERTNALNTVIPEKADIITIDTGWTTQRHVIPKALELLKEDGNIISLVKPHCEAKESGIRYKGKALSVEEALKALNYAIENLKSIPGINLHGYTQSPLTGEKGKNIEYLIWISKKPNNIN
jgi:23S rRNA (cytidine1920-2'-O)/16S rRNA (cytidine1409-2'-O)-methyltransferase